MAPIYHAETDIETLLQIPITATTVVTSTQLAELMLQTEATINARLHDKYITPITGTEALLVIKKIAAKITAGELQRIFGFNYQRTADEETKERVPALLAEGLRMLNRIVSGEDTLTDAVLVCAAEKVYSSIEDRTTGNSESTNFGSNLDDDKY